jgi:hypothetical protein
MKVCKEQEVVTKIAKNRGISQESQAQTQAQGGNGSWILQESKKAVGLIQLDQPLDLTART